MGGLTLITSAKAILGFVRFVRCYYLVVATETKPEGIIMGHVVYSITVRTLIELRIELRGDPAQNRSLLQEQAQIAALSQERRRRWFPRGSPYSLGPREPLSGPVHHGGPHEGLLLQLQLPSAEQRAAQHSPRGLRLPGLPIIPAGRHVRVERAVAGGGGVGAEPALAGVADPRRVSAGALCAAGPAVPADTDRAAKPVSAGWARER